MNNSIKAVKFTKDTEPFVGSNLNVYDEGNCTYSNGKGDSCGSGL